ncbi:hypothetical protein HG536_0H04460 [Torulaspora globosa]|uniref:Uncharacterized protein n=1 Tax=Torulaspora globosa TaxID=48254 RepID=A0A7G3ZNI4_9SACH|nr:uncharacterized protein HG536_0H04460 [Torulaspora globosa]QLL35070.1 hypothetical protein HG536_0H04460 [Torulaspora globosa]
MRSNLLSSSHFSSMATASMTFARSKKDTVQRSRILFCCFLLVRGAMSEVMLDERGLPNLNSTTTSISSSVSSTSSSAQSTSATFTPFIPSSEGNKYVYHATHTGGTVFIAVGSCLAFILGIVLVVWIVFGFSSWRSARKEYKLKDMEEKCQYDPFFYSTFKDTSDGSDSDERSDMSEKVLRNKPSTLSLYSLTSTSMLNLLNQTKNDSAGGDQNVHQSNNRRSMFISPIELLQNEANRTTLWTNDNTSTGTPFDSPVSTQVEQSCTQILNNMDGLTGQARSNIYHHNKRSKSTVDLLPGGGSPSSLEDTSQTRETINNKKHYRSPSIVLDQLLDQD